MAIGVNEGIDAMITDKNDEGIQTGTYGTVNESDEETSHLGHDA